MKIAFIGVGGIAGNYRRSLNRLERPIAAVCDINAERAAQVAAEESASHFEAPPSPGCPRKSGSLRELAILANDLGGSFADQRQLVDRFEEASAPEDPLSGSFRVR